MERLFYEIQNAAKTIATPNWASIVSVIISLLAVLAAAIVAGKQNKIALKQAQIAEQQNKIALFEKRYEIYQIIKECIFFDDNFLEVIENSSDIYRMLCLAFDINTESWKQIDREMILPHILHRTEKLLQSEFLFPEAVAKCINELGINLLSLVNMEMLHIEEDGFTNLKEKFHQNIDNFSKNKVLQEIKSLLNLR